MKITDLEKLLSELKRIHGDMDLWLGCDRCKGGPPSEWHITVYEWENKTLHLMHPCDE